MKKHVNTMKIISWNVNGINSTAKKGLLEYIKNEKAEIYCLQEIKASDTTINKDLLNIPGYQLFWNQAERKGYSGVLFYSKIKPIKVTEDLGILEFDHEGRLQTAEFEKFYLINAYFPNSGRGLPKLDYKIKYNQSFLKYIENLRKKKDVILCGDLNVSHKEVDLANPKSNHKTAGFTDEERNWFTEFLETGYIDTLRKFVPEDENGHYTYWSNRNNARERNIGWRLDYFVVNKEFMKHVKNSEILPGITGSDHCPIRLIFDL